MVTVGVSGGIGSGKTTLCKFWERLGARVVYADPLAKELMVSDNRLIRAIQERFGEKAYLPDGELDRSYLAREAFGSGRADELNQLVHPAVGKEVKKQMKQARSDGVPMFVEEAALLLLHGRPKEFDAIVVVVAPDRQRIDRVMKRDGTTRKEVLARMKRQQSQEELIRFADHIIENDSTAPEFEHRAKELFYTLINKTSGG